MLWPKIWRRIFLGIILIISCSIVILVEPISVSGTGYRVISEFTGRAVGSGLPEGYYVQADYVYPIIYVFAEGMTVILNQSSWVKTGRLTVQTDWGLPFYWYNENSSKSSEWWLYWLNISYFKHVTSSKPFNVSIIKGIHPIGYCFSQLVQPWVGNESLILSPTLTLIARRNDSENWNISGFDSYFTPMNYSIQRKLVLMYDSEGFLLQLTGYFKIGVRDHLYRYQFYWTRISLSVEEVLPPALIISDLGFSVASLVFTSILLGKRVRKNDKKL